MSISDVSTAATLSWRGINGLASIGTNGISVDAWQIALVAMPRSSIMDIDLARQMVRVAFKVSRDLQEVLRALKARCPEEEYRDLARGIAAAIDGVGRGLTSKAISSHPKLEAEIDASITKTGQYE